MTECKICKHTHSKFTLNNKLVCFTCDELLFDIEIECDEEEVDAKKTTKRKRTTADLPGGNQ